MISDIRTLTVLLGLTTATLAGAHGGKTHGPGPKVTKEEAAAFKVAEPVFSKHCYRCHTHAGKKSKAKALQHMDMDRYPFGGHHASEAGAIVRKALGVGGDKATMPADDKGAVSGDALSKLLAWADAFDRARGLEAAKKPAGEHDHTLEHMK